MFGTLQLYTLHCSFLYILQLDTGLLYAQLLDTGLCGPTQDSICIQEETLSGITFRWGRASLSREKLSQR